MRFLSFCCCRHRLGEPFVILLHQPKLAQNVVEGVFQFFQTATALTTFKKSSFESLGQYQSIVIQKSLIKGMTTLVLKRGL